MKSSVFGYSSLGIAIPCYRFGIKGKHVLILGGVHGDEPEGVVAAHGLLDHFSKIFPFKLQVSLVPTFNIDGVINHNRRNGNGVDLNRNLPTNDWSDKFTTERYFPGAHANSEPESQALVQFIKDEKPQFIISLHSWHPLLNVNGSCKEEADIIHKITGYEVKSDIGYPTPGCLGTYAGLERDIHTFTYEIERGLDFKTILKIHTFAVLEALKVTETKG